MPHTNNILIVDDSIEDIFLLENALHHCGLERVESLTSGGDAAKYVAGLPPYQFRKIPDLIFIDIKMRGVDGFDLIQWLHRDPAFQMIPMIVLSGSIDPDEKTKALSLGATAFYEKPQSNDELITIVEKVWHEFLQAA
jgi:CheY-like chemotaxis protein